MSEFNALISELDHHLQPEKSFDLIKRELYFADRSAVLYFIDGLTKDEIFEKIIEFLYKQTPQSLSGVKSMENFCKIAMPYIEVRVETDLTAVQTAVLSGQSALLIENISGALIMDTRNYPIRGIEEPQKDKSLRGARDGFVETLLFNTAMIRRRIRSEMLRMEYFCVGEESKVDVAVAYMDGQVNKRNLNALRKRLKAITVPGISMTQQAFCEALIPTAALNPFPKFKFTERPDYASACILDGKIVLVMDNCPAVMVLPNSFADFFRDVDDYYFSPIVGTYTRLIRLCVTLLTVFATPLFLLFCEHPDWTPQAIRFMLPDAAAALPLFWQLLILEFVVDGLELASLNTPDTLSNSLGIIGGLLLSEFAITAGWFVPQTILFIAFVTIASFSQPSIEMAYAMKFERMILLIAVELFGIIGMAAAWIILTVCKLFMQTVSGRNYLYPIIPFEPKAFLGLFVRSRSIHRKKIRQTNSSDG